jgi:hypothetical protein
MATSHLAAASGWRSKLITLALAICAGGGAYLVSGIVRQHDAGPKTSPPVESAPAGQHTGSAAPHLTSLASMPATVSGVMPPTEAQKVVPQACQPPDISADTTDIRIDNIGKTKFGGASAFRSFLAANSAGFNVLRRATSNAVTPLANAAVQCFMSSGTVGWAALVFDWRIDASATAGSISGFRIRAANASSGPAEATARECFNLAFGDSAIQLEVDHAEFSPYSDLYPATKVLRLASDKRQRNLMPDPQSLQDTVASTSGTPADPVNSSRAASAK